MAIIAAGCVQQQSVVPLPSVPATPRTKLNTLLAQGSFAEAAAAYVELAAAPGEPDSAQLLLRAGLLYADLGDMPRALPLLSPVSGDSVPSMRRALADGLALIQQGDYEKALFTINSLDAAGFDDFEKGLFLRNLGKTQHQTGDQAAILNLLNAELLPMPANRRTELTHLIWEALRSNQDQALLAKVDARNANLAGWLALQQEYRGAMGDPAALSARLADWQLRFGAHPANEILIAEIIELAEMQSAPLQRVALLLPLEGPLAGYAAAIRDGFSAMRFSANDLSLNLRIYAASDASAATAYQRAVSEGAQFVVGPLDKPGIEAISKLPARPIPILALNNLSVPLPVNTGAALPPFTQFGLAPEDDGEDLARQAWQDGHRRMACIVPNSDLGSRIRTAFIDTWGHLGGVLVEDSRYSNSTAAYKAAIKETFSLAQSEARAASLRRTLQRAFVFVAKPRPDLDAVMLVAEPVAARQIMPQFRFLGVDHLPIYATSQIFDGAINPGADQDLDSIYFSAMPWSLNAQDRELRSILNHHWARLSAAHQRLFAFGVDAYRIMKTLPQMSRDPNFAVAGATGLLRRDTTGRIKRALTWAVFRGGVPRLTQSQ